jgi:hypothetical protein
MKVKYNLLFLVTFLLCCSFVGLNTSNQSACSMSLINAKTGKSIKICNKISSGKIDLTLGIAVSEDKEIQDKGEAPLVTINYDGLVIEMQDEFIKGITITNKKWKLNTFTIGSPIEQVMAKHEQVKTNNFYNDLRFKIKDFKGLLFAEVEKDNKIKKLGIRFN